MEHLIRPTTNHSQLHHEHDEETVVQRIDEGITCETWLKLYGHNWSTIEHNDDSKNEQLNGETVKPEKNDAQSSSQSKIDLTYDKTDNKHKPSDEKKATTLKNSDELENDEKDVNEELISQNYFKAVSKDPRFSVPFAYMKDYIPKPQLFERVRSRVNNRYQDEYSMEKSNEEPVCLVFEKIKAQRRKALESINNGTFESCIEGNSIGNQATLSGKYTTGKNNSLKNKLYENQKLLKIRSKLSILALFVNHY